MRLLNLIWYMPHGFRFHGRITAYTYTIAQYFRPLPFKVKECWIC